MATATITPAITNDFSSRPVRDQYERFIPYARRRRVSSPIPRGENNRREKGVEGGRRVPERLQRRAASRNATPNEHRASLMAYPRRLALLR